MSEFFLSPSNVREDSTTVTPDAAADDPTRMFEARFSF
jgi:hypothetical protein